MMEELRRIRKGLSLELWQAAQEGRMEALIARWGREAMKQAREDLRALGLDPRKFAGNCRAERPLPLPRKIRTAVPARTARTKKRRA